MLVAIIKTKHNTGASLLAVSLASMFSKLQLRDSTVMGTRSIEEIISWFPESYIQYGASTTVLQQIIDTLESSTSERFNYAVNSEASQMHILDVFSGKLVESEAIELFTKLVREPNSNPLDIVEISGDLDNEVNREILSLCDTYLIVSNLYTGAGAKIAVIKDKMLTFRDFKDPGVVIMSNDLKAMSTKRMSTVLGIPQKNLFSIPYEPIISSYMLNQGLDLFINDLFAGKGLSKFRSSIVSILQFLYDDGKNKYINTSRLGGDK